MPVTSFTQWYENLENVFDIYSVHYYYLYKYLTPKLRSKALEMKPRLVSIYALLDTEKNKTITGNKKWLY